jgi:hypothetical protein
LLACVAAFGRSLHDPFDPQRFLTEFLARTQGLVPQDRVIINCLDDESRTFTVFAEDSGRDPFRVLRVAPVHPRCTPVHRWAAPSGGDPDDVC